jgi:ribonuclease BN (tRNA processing enzyme)
MKDKVTLFCGGANARESTNTGLDKGGLTTAFCLLIGQYAIQFDLGSGAPNCWAWLKKKLGSVENLMVLLTHTHWDHLLADQNYGGLFRKGLNLIILPAFNFWSWLMVRLYFIIRTHPAFWPVSAEMFGGKVGLRFFKPGTTTVVPHLGEIRSLLMPHPGGVVAYRLKDVIFATDVEVSEMKHRQDLAEFADHAQMFVIDIQWREAERIGVACSKSPLLPMSRVGWGHSTPEMIDDVLSRMQNPPKTILVTHHDPDRSEEDFAAFRLEVRQLLGKYSEVLFAEEGHEYEVGD